MQRTFEKILLWCVIGIFMPFTYGEANLIPSPDFSREKLPASFLLAKKTGPTGKNVLLKSRVDAREYTLYAQPLKLSANTPYQISFWCRGTKISNESATICNIEYYSAQNKYLGAEIFTIGKGDTDWHQVRSNFVSKSGFAKAMIVFYLERKVTGEIAFSAPSISEIKIDQPFLAAENRKLTSFALPDGVSSYLNKRREAYFRWMNDASAASQYKCAEMGNYFQCKGLEQLFQVASNFEKLRSAITRKAGFDDVILGWASAEEKVLPRAPAFNALPSVLRLSAAGNEREAGQLIILPTAQTLEDVQVKVSTLTNDSGDAWQSACSVIPVGYVETKVISPSGSDYIGFYPDPLLSHLNQVDAIKPGDAQSFWVRLEVPAGKKSGIYRGKLSVNIAGKNVFEIPLEARVYHFSLPSKSMLPLAVAFVNRGENMDAWADLLGEYRLSLDNMYMDLGGVNRKSFYYQDFKILKRLKTEGRLNLFCLGYIDEWDADNQDRMKFQIDRIRTRYEKAKESGLLEHSYIYGCDESQQLAACNRVIEIIRKEFPECPILTTAYDQEYGVTGESAFNWYCPLITRYENSIPVIQKARKAGKQVWWYVACGPGRPYPNFFIESPGIATRLLMGAMVCKYRPDGFLYWSLNTASWQGNQPLTRNTFTSWNPQSFGQYNGDGNWTYLGPEKIPLGSIRLENFRDGLDDYAYYEILRLKAEDVRNHGGAGEWLKEAEAALKVPESLVKSLTEFNRDPAELYRYRKRLADLIERAPAMDDKR